MRALEVYAEIDVLVVPSVWYENSLITIHEAFLTGTPVLASSIGGMAEFVRDGVDGLHFAVGDAQDLAAKMERVVSEDGLLERLQSADWMRVKTIDEDGAMTEARYRSLATIVREAVGDEGPLSEAAAVDAGSRSGGGDPGAGQAPLASRSPVPCCGSPRSRCAASGSAWSSSSRRGRTPWRSPAAWCRRGNSSGDPFDAPRGEHRTP